MNALFKIDIWLVVLGAVLLFRQLAIIISAERGRQEDLVRRLYKVNQEHNLSVMVPYLDSNHIHSLLALLGALSEQDYPTHKVTVHIVATQDTKDDLRHEMLRPNVKVWVYPALKARFEQATTWLIDRILAAGGSSICVFLKPDDIVKPDFFQNIVAKAHESFVIQGYVARKTHAYNPIDKVIALSKRLINRIGNAGRHHLGFSCRLMDSGWAIKQDVLEKIPYRRGWDLDNLEYTLRLNLENFRVGWAPNVVVYSDERFRFVEFVTDCVAGIFNRLRLLLQYGPTLIVRGVMKLDISHLEQCLFIVKPPTFFIGLFLFGMTLMAMNYPATTIGTPLAWGGLTVVFMVLQIFGLVVSRCKPKDYVTMGLWTPLIYGLGLFTSPVALVNFLSVVFMGRRSAKKRYKDLDVTRFNEDMAPSKSLFSEPEASPEIYDFLSENVPDATVPRPQAPQARQQSIKNSAGATPPSSAKPAPQPAVGGHVKEDVRSFSLSNGKNSVACLVRINTSEGEQKRTQYQLTLEYKSASFSTATYSILDQAFYELQAKLMARGLTLMACGSCGNFYNPTADKPGALKNAGVCLFGKKGREVNLDTDSVTVLSPECEHHCSIKEREHIVSEWKTSLGQKPATPL